MTDDNVVTFEEKAKEITENSDKELEGFEKIAKKNKENAERIKKERLKKNKGVLRSYRIKH